MGSNEVGDGSAWTGRLSSTGWGIRSGGRRAVALAAVGILGLAVAGCSSDPTQIAVTAAQANVSAKEQALAEAESAAADAATAFCGEAEEYIVALDRYGDVLNETDVTVGDVRDAGADLAEPRDETEAAGEAAVEARDAVAGAEQDLAQAQAKLAEAEAAAAGEEPPEAEPSGEPSDAAEPPASLSRVQRAEQEFEDARAGISDDTPLVEAAAEFNAAAVALEMAWLQLFADLGCLTDDQQEQAASAVREYTLALQQDLADAGYFEGEVDGVYGPETVEAVKDLQEANGLPQTGAMDKATEAALRSELAEAGGAAAQESVASTAAVQQTLALAGYWDGPIDGEWSDELTDALKEFQTDLGVEPTGTVDAATVAAFQKALETAQQTPSPSASPDPGGQSPEPTETDADPSGSAAP